MTDKQIIEYKHIKCTKDDCCHYCGSVFCGYVDDIENLEKAYKAKEQECEELKEARKNSRCAWKSLEGTFCPQAQEQLNAYKMEADEGKEINAELKAENETYKKILEDEDVQLALIEIRSGERHLWHNKADKLSKTLTEIKEIVFPKNQLIITDSPIILKIQQKISEVSNDMENN